jgi:hypothetical protein
MHPFKRGGCAGSNKEGIEEKKRKEKKRKEEE